MIQRIFKTSSSIASAAVILGLAGLLSRFLGVYRDRLLASTFGAGSALDAYYAAFRLPDFVFNLLVLGALSAGFIPVFSEYLTKSKKDAWRLSQAVFTALFVLLTFICLVIFAFTPQLVALMTPGFSGEVLEQTITLTRIMLLSPILLGLSSVFGGILQSFKQFLAYSLSPILYNLGIVFSLFVFIEPFGLKGLGYGVVLGAILHLTVQFLIARKLGWKFAFVPFWKEQGLKEIVKLMGPRTAALAITQVNLLVITVIASTLGEGRLAIFNLAQNLAHVPIGLFGVSFAVAAFPVLSMQFCKKQHEEFRRTVYSTLAQVLFFLLPTIVIYALLDEQIVRLVLGAGQFDWESTLLTARTLLFLIPGILAQSLLPLFTRVYYAQKNTAYPFFAAVFGLVVMIASGWFFTQGLGDKAQGTYVVSGIAGLAAAFSLASIAQLLALLFSKYVRPSGKIYLQFKESFIHMLQASIIMFIAIQLTKRYTGPYLNLLTVKGVLMHFVLPVAIGGVVYLAILRAFKTYEYLQFENAVKQKLHKFSSSFLPLEASSGEDDFFDN